VAQAVRNAEKIILSAKKQAQEIIDGTLANSKDLACQKRRDFEEQFLSEKERLTKEAKIQTTHLRESRERDIQKIAQEIFRQIINIEG
jgi:vacuolar-type H+-ATPase subunit H